MNNIEKISNEPTPVAAMTSSQGTPSSNTPILPGFNDDDLDSLDDNETTTQCGACTQVAMGVAYYKPFSPVV
ncbi:hypothetical protein RSOL_521730, partial [Rhizoctonia solani AG-3 Rhs1AP]